MLGALKARALASIRRGPFTRAQRPPASVRLGSSS